ncbi:MAG: nicotinate-nucleotide adenylyltransferase [Actinomycetaceae bacterium]|nr:nicotinate-nucleotide adenylyltransferase [Actinomycetaceae bacterium]
MVTYEPRRERDILIENERLNQSAEKKRRRIGIMGGTFDPIHNGHLATASEVHFKFQLDTVIFVPTGNQPYKDANMVTLPEIRYQMTCIATFSDPRFSVSRVDIDRGGTTYTYDTLKDMKQLYPNDELFFITGADAFSQILGWKNSEKLADMAHFIGVTRPGHSLDIAGIPFDNVTLLEVPPLAISSTDCRRRVMEGKPIRYLVPDGVIQHIDENQLYRGHNKKSVSAHNMHECGIAHVIKGECDE